MNRRTVDAGWPRLSTNTRIWHSDCITETVQHLQQHTCSYCEKLTGSQSSLSSSDIILVMQTTLISKFWDTIHIFDIVYAKLW